MQDSRLTRGLKSTSMDTHQAYRNKKKANKENELGLERT